MKAYIYNDEKGEDITVTDIPEDMQDDAELYRSEPVSYTHLDVYKRQVQLLQPAPDCI